MQIAHNPLALVLTFAVSTALAQADLTQPPPLAPDVQAYPRLTAAPQVAQKINTRLAVMDATMLSAYQNCSPGHDGAFSAGVEVTLNATHYLSLLTQYGGFCPGAAHGFAVTYATIFDLATGEEINPETWLPAPLDPGPVPLTYDEAAEAARYQPLTDLYLSALPPDPYVSPDMDCRQILQTDLHGFDLWPQASPPALIVQPNSLAYIDQPCETPVAIPLATLQSLRFAPDLLADLGTP